MNMRRHIIVTAILVLTCGCHTMPPVDPYVLKSSRSWTHTIDDPYEWSRVQIREAAPIDKNGGLCRAEADIDGDGARELFVHADVPGRVHVILAFKRVRGGYRYIGDFTACRNRITNPKHNTLTVYEACGGHNGYVRTYVNDENRFKRVWSSELLSVGDGAPGTHSEKVERLGRDCPLKWERAPNKTRSRGEGEGIPLSLVM